MGIDLGTSYCSVAVFQDGGIIKVVPDETGSRRVSSCVVFNDDECLVGNGAKRFERDFPEHFIYGVKRLIGRSFSDAGVQEDLKRWSFRVVSGPSDEVMIEVPGPASADSMPGTSDAGGGDGDDDGDGDGVGELRRDGGRRAGGGGARAGRLDDGGGYVGGEREAGGDGRGRGGRGGGGGGGGGCAGPAQRRRFRPEEISALLLMKMKKMAEDFTGCAAIREAVISVPANFTDSQREATWDAAVKAGLKVLRLISEPAAAVLAYGHQRLMNAACERRTVMAFDLGAGSFDVSIVTVNAGNDIASRFLVKAVAGDGDLGGTDFDNRLITHVMERIATLRKRQRGGGGGGGGRRWWWSRQDNRWDSNKTPQNNSFLSPPRRGRHGPEEGPLNPSLPLLRNKVIAAKHALSTANSVSIHIEQPSSGEIGTEIEVRLDRSDFEQMNQDLFDRCMVLVEEVLRDAGMGAEDISDVILVGGSTRIPRIRQMLAQFFGRPTIIADPVDADESVAYGAAVMAGMLTYSDAHRSQYSLPVSVQEVTPLSIGVRSTLDQMNVLIPRNSPLPASGSMLFTTSTDFQTGMLFRIYEGERPLCKHNRFLGLLLLKGLASTPAVGSPMARLILTVDSDGILHATAEGACNQSTGGAEKKVVVTFDSITVKLDKERASSVLQKAQACAGRDEAVRSAFTARRKLRESALELRKGAQGLSPRKKAAMEKKVKAVLKWLSTEKHVAPKEEYDRRANALKSWTDRNTLRPQNCCLVAGSSWRGNDQHPGCLCS
ncbi:hypothetical protein CBR_g53490 [Chara braunii]|uniref:Uncharacterized protein n=1 Tax=Chara braunii TaxID=69332 RepID=A0A388MAT0_CHABU|nr:hypothetical protein CBR_g53490 [Chara braunii]|eukprot:GBG91677.1 hypothetical protein CBR_g53490 [Chara braunii]